jgi:hypothetical protein
MQDTAHSNPAKPESQHSARPPAAKNPKTAARANPALAQHSAAPRSVSPAPQNVAVVLSAYLLFWLVLIGFLLKLHHRQKRIRTRLDELEKTVTQAQALPKKQSKGDST